MNSIYFFGNTLNGLEYITYVIIPVSIILVLLVYIYFNLRVLRDSFKISNEDKYKVLDFIFNEDIETSNKGNPQNKILNFISNENIETTNKGNPPNKILNFISNENIEISNELNCNRSH